MFRMAIISFVVYLWGSPGYESLRPEALATPLETFHFEVSEMVTEAYRAVGIVDDFRQMQHLARYTDSINQSFQ